MMKTVVVALALTGLGLAAANARADEWDKKTLITFSQAVEIPGHVLPAGTYMFKLAESIGNRHIVQVFTADGSRILATVMTIPDYRLRATDQTVIKFREVPPDSAEAIRAWFYPGNTIGQEFVYPMSRAIELAITEQAVVPALNADVGDPAALRTAPIVAITPEAKEVPVAVAIQMTPDNTLASVAPPTSSPPVVGTIGVGRTGEKARHLPKTASALPPIVVFGLGCIGVAFGLLAFGRRATAYARHM